MSDFAHVAAQGVGILLGHVVSLFNWWLLAAAIFIPFERLFFRRRQPILRRRFGEDLWLYFIGGLIPPLFAALLAWVCSSVAKRVLPPAYFESISQIQPWALVIVVLLCGEVMYYWAHRICHEVPWLWRLHRVHHSAEEMDWLVNTRVHPLDLVFTHVLSTTPLLLLGLGQFENKNFASILVCVAVFNVLWAFFIHSNLRWRLGPLEKLITTPAFHHWHHNNDGPGSANRNYAAVFPWVDRLFGSHYLPPKEWPQRYGIDEPLAEGVWALLSQGVGIGSAEVRDRDRTGVPAATRADSRTRQHLLHGLDSVPRDVPAPEGVQPQCLAGNSPGAVAPDSAVGADSKLSHGGAAENLDWLNGDSQALPMPDRAARTKGDLDPLLVVPPDVCVQACDEFVDGRVQPVASEEHLDLQAAKESLACGIVWRTPFARHGSSQLGVGNPR